MKLSVRITRRFAEGPDSAGFLLDVELEAEAGITILFGASGAGKSLTLDSIAGFTRPDSGRILLGDSILFDGETRINIRPQDRECGYVFQNYALFPHMTVRENLAFAAERLPRLERHRRVTETIERFQLSDVAGRLPREVSGGQRQRCSIARAMIGAPRILLLDEPATGLDAGRRADLYELLRDLRREVEVPLLLVTHSLDEAVALGDRMLVFQAGKIVQAGTPHAVLSRPKSVETARLLGHFNVLPAEILALDPGRNTSRLKIANGEMAGPYFPGHFIGDRETLLVSADRVRVHSAAGDNRVAVQLESVMKHAHLIELRFSQSLTALVPYAEFECRQDLREWFVEFPPEDLRLVDRGSGS